MAAKKEQPIAGGASSPYLKARRILRELFPLAAGVAIVTVTRTSFANHYVVPSGSMEPSVAVGDRVLVDMRAYGLRDPSGSVTLATGEQPRRGDVVVLDSPESGITLLKRVVALPRDVVEVRGGKLVLNGTGIPTMRDAGALAEQLDGRWHSIRLGHYGGPDFPPSTVPDGHYLVLGDNRENSHDGRAFGWVRREAIRGRAVAVFAREGAPTWVNLSGE